MFIKTGGNDGKILTIIDPENITEEQKKSAKDLSNKTIKTSESSDTQEKELGK